jgi:hypothetical protein
MRHVSMVVFIIYTYIYIHIYIYVYICIYMCVQVFIYTQIHEYTHVYIALPLSLTCTHSECILQIHNHLCMPMHTACCMEVPQVNLQVLQLLCKCVAHLCIYLCKPSCTLHWSAPSSFSSSPPPLFKCDPVESARDMWIVTPQVFVQFPA